MKSILLAQSTTPGQTLSRLSDLGISITRTGEFQINETTLSAALASNLDDIRTIFSADTEDQTELGEASRGLAGDLSKFITDLTGTTGYLTTRSQTLTLSVAEYEEDLVDLETKMANLQERYTRQFAAMNALVGELNNTRDNLVNSFENLPFTNSRD